MIVPSHLPAASEFGIIVKNVTDSRVAMNPAVPDSIEGEIVKVSHELDQEGHLYASLSQWGHRPRCLIPP